MIRTGVDRAKFSFPSHESCLFKSIVIVCTSTYMCIPNASSSIHVYHIYRIGAKCVSLNKYYLVNK